MGGQTCVFYGAPEFSRDCDILFVPLGHPTIAHRFNGGLVRRTITESPIGTTHSVCRVQHNNPPLII